MKKITRKAAVSALALMALTFPAQASILINWGGDYVSSTQNLVFPTPVGSDSLRTWSYNATTPISPSSGYNGTVFYGAQQIQTTSGNASFGQIQVFNSGTTDRIIIQTNNITSGNMTSFVFFKKENFSGVGVGDTVELASSSYFSANLTAFAGGSSFRAAILNSGTWYLSNSTLSGTGLKTFSNLSSLSWGAWNPTGAPFEAAPTSFTTAGTDLKNVQGVGFWAFSARGATPNLASVASDQIIFDAVVVPEPTTWVLLAGSLTALVVFRRRRRV